MIPDNITKDHILKALAEIDQMKEVPLSRKSDVYDLLYNGKRYPPKYVISLANKYVNTGELPGTSFLPAEMRSFFKRIGLEIVKKDDAGTSNSILISKIAWSYNGWTGFDSKGYENRDKFGYAYIKEFGIAHEWWSFYDFDPDYYYGHIEVGERKVRAFENGGLILLASTDIDKKEYKLVGFFGNAEWGNFALPQSLWDTLATDMQLKIAADAKDGVIDKTVPDELKRRTAFQWRGKKEFSARFRIYVPFNPQDFGVPSWGQAPYITVGKTPGKFNKEQTKDLLVRVIAAHKALLSSSTGQEKEEIESIIKKAESVLNKYFETKEDRKYWQIAPGPQASSWTLCVEKGIIPIFFNDILGKVPDDILNYSREQLTEYCRKTNEQVRDGQIGARVSMIWDFIHSVQIGDFVLANKGHSLAVGWGVITSDAKICRNGSEISFYRNVDWKDPALNKPLDPELGRHFFITIQQLKKEQFDSVVFPDMNDKELISSNPLFTKIQSILDYKKQVILYGPPGTGKTWTVSNFVNGKKRVKPDVKIITTDKKFFWFSANPGRWDPGNLWKGQETDLWYGSIRSAFNDIEEGDLLFVYVSRDHHRIFGIAVCSKKEYDSNNIPKVFIKGIQPVDGPEWTEMKEDPVLSNAKPVRMGARGTLFPLDQYEGLRLLEMAKISPGSIGITIEEQQEKIDNCTFVTFHPSYSYEEFIEGLRPEKDENGNIYYRDQEGIFKKACRTACNTLLQEAGIEREWVAEGNPPLLSDEEIRTVQQNIHKVPVYFVIDEINRGDISRIFGELITLIEADKRLLMDSEISCTLPYSKLEFGIPPNLYIIGTMNTADRSISLMDIALRRRFGFCELLPEYDALQDGLLSDPDINPETRTIRELAVNVLRAVNTRLQEKYDRDHQIGHSYLIKLAEQTGADETATALKNIWYYEILPLLQEYFFDSPEKLLYVLNGRFYMQNGSSFSEKPEEDFIAALQAVARQKQGTLE